MRTADFLVIGGGIAGLSAAARLARHGRVIVLEGEDALGYHSSGRSATFTHLGIGNATVRALTSHSRAFFDTPPEGFAETPLAEPTPAMFIADEPMLPELDALHARMAAHSDAIRRIDMAEAHRLCPVLRDHVVAAVLDETARKLDADALLQGYARAVRAAGGEVATGARIASIEPRWTVATASGERFSAPVLVNAAGAWADDVARRAGVAPLGLQPLRRTIIVLDPPPGIEARGWPFVKTAADEFYMLTDAGRILASPVDEVDSEPADAQPEDYDIALAAWRTEQWTTLPVDRIQHRWAGLRSFVADRVPTAGFAPDAPGFFWLAGQGGYGLQTAPAMAEIAEALVTGADWPANLSALGVARAAILPERLG